VPGTGQPDLQRLHEACIYQKQEPVNIPQIETGVLTDVLQLPWASEIYGLLTRWNPPERATAVSAALQRPQRARRRSRPGGYTLAHYLLNKGFGVVAVDGLKIEPLPAGARWKRRRRRGAAADRAVGRGLSRAGRADPRGLRRRLGGTITVRWDKTS